MDPSAANSPEATPRARAVRLQDIAKLAGVHLTTVSSVLSPRARNHTRVGKETAERIRALAQKLNYRPDHHAQMMRRRNTGIIALMEFGRSELHSRRTISLAHAVQKHGYRSLIVNPLWYDEEQERSSLQAAIDYVLNSRPEGIILITPTIRLSRRQIGEMQEAGVPCVVYNGIHFPGVPQVRSDAEMGFREMTRHLIAQGHRDLGLLVHWGTAGRDESTCWPTLERVRGFTAAIEEAGGKVQTAPDPAGLPKRKGLWGSILLPEETKPVMADMATSYRLVRTLLGAGRRFEALVCPNDSYARGALRACYEAGVSVPGQMAVTGFGNEDDGPFLSPALTSIDVAAGESAERASEVLLEMIRSERPLHDGYLLRTACSLVVRESCGGQAGQPMFAALQS